MIVTCVGIIFIQELGIFNTVLRDVFCGLPKPGPLPYHVTKVEQDFENLLVQYTREKGLVPHSSWIAKVNQLRSLSKVHNGWYMLLYCDYKLLQIYFCRKLGHIACEN